MVLGVQACPTGLTCPTRPTLLQLNTKKVWEETSFHNMR